MSMSETWRRRSPPCLRFKAPWGRPTTWPRPKSSRRAGSWSRWPVFWAGAWSSSMSRHRSCAISASAPLSLPSPSRRRRSPASTRPRGRSDGLRLHFRSGSRGRSSGRSKLAALVERSRRPMPFGPASWRRRSCTAASLDWGGCRPARHPGLAQDRPHRREESRHILLPRRITHQTHAPDLPRERAEPSADLDVVLGEQASSHYLVVHSLGDAQRGEHRQPMLLLDERLQSQSFGPAPELFGDFEMTQMARLEPLLKREAQRLAQRVDHVAGRRVVIDALRAPVSREQRDVQIPRRGRTRSLSDRLERTWGKGDRREPWRSAQTLLRAAVADIDTAARRALGVDGEPNARQRRDRVDDHQ